MTTVILVGLIVVLAVAAAYVGLLLVRRWRPSSSESGRAAPWTVGDLVRMRNGRPQLSGSDLFTPAAGLPVIDSVVDDAAPGVVGERGAPTTGSDDGAPARRGSAAPAAHPDGPTDGVDVGDAPWRRAARMNGTEPGGAWETAPTPTVPPAARVVNPDGAEVRRPAGSSRRDVAVEPEAEPEPDAVEPVATEADPEPVPADPEPVAASRPLSDPDLTPLMGIPLVRPSAVTIDDPPPADPPDPDDAAAAAAPSGSTRHTDPVPAPPPRTSPVRSTDDEVVSLLSADVATARVTVTGSPQPIWMRVVRRDGDPVADAVVTLLDDLGQQVDATKTAADGGGELRAPHGGRFLLIAGRDGFQPRAVTLAVDDAPVEVALLLPGSATLAGLVCGDGRPVAGARVVARQEGEVVDEIVTGPDGSYRFDDLAEGAYAVTATDRVGSAVLRLAVRESADLHHDLDLVPPGGAR